MKKCIGLLCAIVCALGLTACSEKAQYSEYQQYKLEKAEEVCVGGYIPILIGVVETDGVESYEEYTPQEVEAIFSEYQMYVDGSGFVSALQSFQLNRKTTGAVKVKQDAPVVKEVDGKTIIVRVQASGEKKDAEIELILSNDSFLTLQSAALNPISSKSELLGKAGLNTLLGMGTVFSVLILISLIIACFGYIPKLQSAFAKKEKEVVTDVTGIENAVAQIAQQEETYEETDDLELVAVISAAIAAYEGTADASGYVVRSIRRINR